MRHLDFTIDFETCSLSANAAVMQVAIVPWLRDNDADPFCNEQEVEPFVGYVDLRTCVVGGFDFDPSTVKWWSERSEAAKKAVTAGLPEPVSEVLITALDYIRYIKKRKEVDSICLWCQGPDVDIAILRNLCRKYDVILEDIIPHTSFRDCRTVILEAALIKRMREIKERNEQFVKSGKAVTDVEIMPDGSVVPCTLLPDQILAGSYDVYKMFAPLPDRYAAGSEAHDALYDALRSSWNTWQALRWMKE